MASIAVYFTAGGTLSYVQTSPGTDLLLTADAGGAMLFPDQSTAAAYVAAHGPVSNGAAPVYQVVVGDENYGAGTLL